MILTIEHDLDSQDESACQISRSRVISFESYNQFTKTHT